MTWTRSFAPLLLAAGLVGCGGPAEVKDTGYVGTWSRGSDYVRSTLAIVRDGESYRVRWHLTSQDGGREVRCDWQGVCEESVEGKKVADFKLTPAVDPESGHLRIEMRGTAYKPEAVELHFIDELTLRARPKGTELVARTLEESGKRFERDEQPKRIFRKVTDTVDDPPPTLPEG